MSTQNIQLIVTEIVAESLVWDERDLQPDTVLDTIGFDSLDAMEVASELSHQFNIDVDESDIASCRTVAAITAHITGVLNGAEQLELPTMDKIRHQDMVALLVKPGDKIARELTGDEANLLHMVVGIAGEAGELLDAIKKHTIYRKKLDLENVIEELGDLEFYMEGLRAALGITRTECLEANIEKLRVRYEGLKYSDTAAQDRADKAG